jgi:hypothetical protein
MTMLIVIIAIILALGWIITYTESLKEEFNVLLEKSKREDKAQKAREQILKSLRGNGI